MLDLPLTEGELQFVNKLAAKKLDEFLDEHLRNTKNAVFEAQRCGRVSQARGIQFDAEMREVTEREAIKIQAVSEILTMRKKTWTPDIAQSLRNHIATNLETARQRMLARAQNKSTANPRYRGEAFDVEQSFREARITLLRDFDIEVLKSTLQEPQQVIVSATTASYDAFICHATEDKEAVARPLASALSDMGFRIWYDEFVLRVGDSLRQSIDKGLAGSRFGIVILSPDFFAKAWPQYELNGLTAKEISGQGRNLFIWHNIDEQGVLSHSPPLAGRIALDTASRGIKQIADVLGDRLRKQP